MPNAEHTAVVTDLTALEAVIFDLDGVVTRTAELHADAWKRLFDEYLASRAAGANEPPIGRSTSSPTTGASSTESPATTA